MTNRFSDPLCVHAASLLIGVRTTLLSEHEEFGQTKIASVQSVYCKYVSKRKESSVYTKIQFKVAQRLTLLGKAPAMIVATETGHVYAP